MSRDPRDPRTFRPPCTARGTDWGGTVGKLVLLADLLGRVLQGSIHRGLLVLTQAFDCDSKGGKKWPRSRPRPPSQLARHCPFNQASCPGSEKGLGALRAGRWALIQGQGERDDSLRSWDSLAGAGQYEEFRGVR